MPEVPGRHGQGSSASLPDFLVDLEAGRRRFLAENLAEQGLSTSEIASRLGVSKKAVQRKLRAWHRRRRRDENAGRAYATWCLNATREIPAAVLAARSRGAARRVYAYGGVVEGAVDLAAVIARDKAICHICGEAVEPCQLAFDHVVPLVHGGAHATTNVRVAHARCNGSKGARL